MSRDNNSTWFTLIFTMSCTSKNKPSAKFRGFTDNYKLNEKGRNKEANPHNLAEKQLFVGFTVAYKNPEPPQEEWGKTETNCSFFNIPKLKPILKPNEIPEVHVDDRNFKPTKYRIWSENKFKEALARNKNEHGPSRECEESDQYEDIDGIWLQKFKYYTTRNEQRGRQYANYYDSTQFEHSNQEDGKRFQQQNAPPRYRDLNNYPQKYQFDLMNKRMRKFLKEYDTDDHDQSTDIDSGSINTCCLPPDYDKLAAERRALTEYMNAVVKRRINFQPENFSSWYSKLSFKFDKKYKNIPDIKTTADEDFHSWSERVQETINRGRRIPAEKIEGFKYEKKESIGKIRSMMNSTSLEDWKPSISYCSTC